jgi:hypothetical protein
MLFKLFPSYLPRRHPQKYICYISVWLHLANGNNPIKCRTTQIVQSKNNNAAASGFAKNNFVNLHQPLRHL